MSKHTPGPWKHSGSTWDDVIELHDSKDVYIGEVQRESAVDDANAALIAAAPELLEALKAITDCVHMEGPAGTTAYLISDSRMDAAKVAISKAEGRGL